MTKQNYQFVGATFWENQYLKWANWLKIENIELDQPNFSKKSNLLSVQQSSVAKTINFFFNIC